MPKSSLNTDIVKTEDSIEVLKEVLTKKGDKVISRQALYSSMFPLTRKAIRNLNTLLNAKDPRVRLRAIEIVLAKTLPDLKSTESKTESTIKHGVVMLPPESIIPIETQLKHSQARIEHDKQVQEDTKRSIKLPNGKVITHDPNNVLIHKRGIDNVTPQV